jgi:hypothetical protein
VIGGMIEHAVLRAQARLGAGANVAVWLAVAGVVGVIGVVFLTIALDVWLASLWGAPLAALCVGGLYLALAGIAAVIAIKTQRSNRAQARQRLARAAAHSAFPLDPKLLALGLQLGKSLGWRRLVPLAVAGVGILAAVAAGRGLQERPEDSQDDD